MSLFKFSPVFLSVVLLSSLFDLSWLKLRPKGDSAGGGKVVADSRFNRDGFLKVDGAARLIIGLYELPKDDEELREIAENGFNLIRTPQDVNALDRVHKHNLCAWICLDSAVKLTENDKKGEQALVQIVNSFKDHPALLVWELPDEVIWNVWWFSFDWNFGGQQRQLREHIENAKARAADSNVTKWLSQLEKAEDYNGRGLWKQAEEIYDGLWEELDVKNPHPEWKMSQCPGQADQLTDSIARGCRVVRGLDSRHIIWQNHAPRNSVDRLRKYNQVVDVAGCDIYPVPFTPTAGHSDLKDTNLSCVGAYTDRMRQSASGKPVWMVLQGFGWRDLSEQGRKDPDPAKGRRPNLQETRFMAYDAIVHGANAILYWGTDYIEKDSPLWRDLMTVVRQIRALEPAIVGGRAAKEPTVIADEPCGSIDGQGPRLMLRKVDADWVLVAVNEHSQAISFRIHGLPKQMEGKTLYRLYSDRMHVVKDAGLEDGIRGFDVHIYSTSRRFEVK